MPRYFFHVRDGEFIPDLEGTELPDDTAACREAVITAGNMLADIAAGFWNTGEWTMVVIENDREVCILTFSGKNSPGL
ncbi:hypothetical protein ASE94_11185 [Devosia sp. Leaf64]|nr:hypothetical protein ASE94_11185 [Devosia sp. Leaf64]